MDTFLTSTLEKLSYKAARKRLRQPNMVLVTSDLLSRVHLVQAHSYCESPALVYEIVGVNIGAGLSLATPAIYLVPREPNKPVSPKRSNNFAALTLVLGNESCDLDSAVSALVYAAYLTWQHLHIQCKVCTKVHREEPGCKEDIFVPILNVDREDYVLKTEVVFCLNEHGVDDSMLVFRDDYDLQELTSSRETRVILVDHHVMSGMQAFLAPLVAEVIDHRPADKGSWIYKDDTRSTIELVGSCCTLVAQRIRALCALVAQEQDFFRAYPSCTDLLHCAIIVDTVNFSKELNKATPLDEESVQMLENILEPRNYDEDRQCKLARLTAARAAVGALAPAQLLRKDVKALADVLVPSFPILVEEFLSKPGALRAVSEALAARECSAGLLLGMCLGPALRRDGAVYAPQCIERAEKLHSHLLSWTSPDLQLSPRGAPGAAAGAPGLLYFTQGCISASRKQYMPAVTQFLQNE